LKTQRADVQKKPRGGPGALMGRKRHYDQMDAIA
jgi:hypothetical protein